MKKDGTDRDTGRMTSKVLRTFKKARFALRPGSLNREMQTRIEGVCGELSAASKKAEPDFLSFGEGLQTIHSDVNNLTQRIRDSLGALGGDSGEGDRISAMSKVGEFSAAVSAELRACSEDIEDRLRRVDGMGDLLSSLIGSCPELERISILLRMVSMNVGIESAGCSGAAELFGVVSEDVVRLSAELARETTSSHEELETARRTQTSAREQISKGLEELRAMVLRAEHAVEEAAKDAERMMAFSMSMLEQADSRSVAISERVSQLVISLQFHDSMTQRMDHVTQALQSGCAYIAGGSEGKKARGRGSEWAKLHTIVMLQRAQLARVTEELRTVRRSQDKALVEIHRQISGLVRGLSETSGNDSPDQSIFQELHGALKELDGLFEKGNALSRDMDAASEAASESAKRVEERLEGINSLAYRLRIIALNSIVKSASLEGCGDTLDVLSQEVQRLAYSAEDFVSRITGLLKELLDLARTLRGRKDADGEDSLDKGFAEIFSRLIDDLKAAWEAFRFASAEVVRRSERLASMLGGMQERLDFMNQLGGVLDSQLAELSEIEKRLSPWAEEHGGEADESAGGLAVRYTMKKERDTHREALGVFRPGPMVIGAGQGTLRKEAVAQGGEADETSAELTSDDGDLGDNVELF